MIVSIHQPNFLPWLGYFNKIALSDVFVILDEVQFPRGTSVANRNKIKTPNGALNLTVPVSIPKGFQGKVSYREVNFADPNWYNKALKTIKQNYSRSDYYNEYNTFLEQNFQERNFCDMTINFIKFVVEQLSISTKIYKLSEINNNFGNKSDLVVNICKHYGADIYLSGTGAKKYNNQELYEQNGIELKYQDYRHPVYAQLYGDFVSHLSIIDLLFNCGPKSKSVLMNES